MSDATPSFAMPFIVPGQAQKEAFHNEALTIIDAALHLAVEGPPLGEAPAAPAAGQCWIVGPNATGEWAGKSDRVAAWSEGGWRFIAPRPGMTAWSKADGLWFHWTGTAWSLGMLPAAGLTVGGLQVVGERQPSIASPSGGTIIDAEARGAVNLIIATLMSHGLIE